MRHDVETCVRVSVQADLKGFLDVHMNSEEIDTNSNLEVVIQLKILMLVSG